MKPDSTQQPDWPDRAALAAAVAELWRQPALVAPRECDRLREELAAVTRGEAFVLQGGDCAETFAALAAGAAARTASLLLRMGAIIAAGAGLPVVTAGRIAGQYCKPRSSPTETRDGLTLPAYRGDAVNGAEFSARARIPDPGRLVRAYAAASATLRTLPDDVFASHEALLLPYEESLARTDARTGRRYGTSGHLLWIGERTRCPEGAHARFAASVANPVAVKLGPSATPAEAVRLARLLNPAAQAGRLSFIARMGARRVRDVLAPVVERVAAEGIPVAWICDPMHGNTWRAPGGRKTRSVSDVLGEIKGFFEVHRALGSHPGGVHLEIAGEEVTECVGGSHPVALHDLDRRYETACDPRLSRSQAIDVAIAVAGLLAGRSARAFAGM